MKKTLVTMLLSAAIFGATANADSLTLSRAELIFSSESVFKNSIIFSGENFRLRVDCQDAREPSNTIVYLLTENENFKNQHEIFTGITDFYCHGLLKFRGNIGVNDKVDIEVIYSDTASSGYQTMTIEDLRILVSETDVRSYMDNPGTSGEFKSMEPVE